MKTGVMQFGFAPVFYIPWKEKGSDLFGLLPKSNLILGKAQ